MLVLSVVSPRARHEARTLPLPIHVVCGVVVLPSFTEVEQVQVVCRKSHAEGETP
jgi:hypothetical protein